MTDVFLQNLSDGGEIHFKDGDFVKDNGIATTTYLLLFGGNELDTGGDDRSQSWWGNAVEDDPNKYRSQTHRLLRSTPATTGNLNKLYQVISTDLQPLLDDGLVNNLSISLYIPRRNWVDIKIQTESETLKISAPWEVV